MSGLNTMNTCLKVNPLNGTRIFGKPKGSLNRDEQVRKVSVRQKTALQQRRSERKADPNDDVGL